MVSTDKSGHAEIQRSLVNSKLGGRDFLFEILELGSSKASCSQSLKLSETTCYISLKMSSPVAWVFFFSISIMKAEKIFLDANIHISPNISSLELVVLL